MSARMAWGVLVAAAVVVVELWTMEAQWRLQTRPDVGVFCLATAAEADREVCGRRWSWEDEMEATR